MDITSVLIFQIIADVALCIAVLFLLISIGRKVNKANPRAVDGEHLVEFQKLLGQSQQDAALFFAKLDESFSKFQDLTLKLDEKEERLRALIGEVGQLHETPNRGADGQSNEEKHKRIMKYLQSGISIADIAARMELTAGEVKLICDIENKKKETSK